MLNKMFFASSAAAALIASSAMAEGYFTMSDGTTQDSDSVVELGGVTADTDGTVVVYSYQGGEFGEMLGSEMISAGANSDVMVDIGATKAGTVAAVLYSGAPTSPADAVDWIEIDLQG